MILLKHVIKQQAIESNRTEKEIETILKYYWREGVEKEMLSFEHESLYLKNLGTFLLPLPLLRAEILKIIKKVRQYRTCDTDVEIYKYNFYLDYLRKLLKIRTPIAKRYTDYWQERKRKKRLEQ